MHATHAVPVAHAAHASHAAHGAHGAHVDMSHAVLASHEHMRIMLRPLRMGGIQILMFRLVGPICIPQQIRGRPDLPRIKEQVPIAPLKK